MGGTFSSAKPALDLVDLKGKVIVVTGGNSGIGYETIKILAKQGAKLYMAARNESRVTGAISRLEHEGVPAGSVHWLKLDLGDPRQAKKAAEELITKENRVDVLINNAAIIDVPFELTSDGLSQTMVTNYLSPFVFTKTLLPLLKQTASLPGSDVRIVNVSSKGHNFIGTENNERPRFDSVEAFNKTFGDGWKGTLKRYAWSKLAQILYTRRLQRELKASATPITVIAIHPGEIKTSGVILKSDVPWYISFLYALAMLLSFKSVEYGGYTPAFAAASKEIAANKDKFAGVYLEPYGKIVKGSKWARNDELGDELWTTTEKFVEGLGL
ncbi:NAD(P)-binding protein [Sistotremastrum suecicum HHB10207 ss-3]|uniref:NAD(P)-binding protein n=1 Tax=Sistotremastrum suecicum HHB10207 ss-3 TaxID=1314776 RepID=A0A165ZUP0_9AGAM|nr:NAD(P)-binding protein [Sistotremastrum suecicum HHB10207 ss-3]